MLAMCKGWCRIAIAAQIPWADVLWGAKLVTQVKFFLVIDANILIKDFWLKSQEFKFLSDHSFLDHKPVIPYVAFLEAKNHLRQRANNLLANRDARNGSSVGNRARLLRIFNYKRAPVRGRWDVEGLLLRWEKNLLNTLSKANGYLLPNPIISMEEIVSRSISRTRPFSAGDRGFRDTLIWLSALDLVNEQSRVSFVTNNTQDFFSEGSDDPHPEVLAEADVRLGENVKMLFHRSLESFISTLDGDKESSSSNLRNALVSNRLPGFDLWAWVEENLLTLTSGSDFDLVEWAGIAYHAEAPTLTEVEELVNLDVPIVSHLDGSVYSAYCDLSILGLFECDIGFAEAETIAHPRQIVWKSEGDYWTKVCIRATATFALRVDIDMEERSVVSAYLTPLRHWASYEEVTARLDEIAHEEDEQEEEEREQNEQG